MSDDELPPPLEDCSSLLKSKQTVETKPKQRGECTPPIDDKNVNKIKQTGNQKKKSKAICGFPSGFLNKKKKKRKGRSSKKLLEPTKSSNDILLVDTVKEKLLKDQTFLDGLISDKDLTTAMMQPKFATAIKELEADPRKTLEKYKGDPEVIPVLQKLMKKMEESFARAGAEQQASTSAGIKEVGSVKKAPSVERVKPTPDQMQRWMADPIIRSALACPEVQNIIERAQRSPDLIMEYKEHPKIKILIESGILKINC